MSLKDRVGSDASRGAATELAGGDLKGKDFRRAKRALNKQDRVNNRAKRKASRRGDQIKDGYEGYKGFSTKETQADRYFDELSKKRTRNIVAGTAAAALTGGAALGAFGAGAAGGTAATGLLAGTGATGLATGGTAATGLLAGTGSTIGLGVGGTSAAAGLAGTGTLIGSAAAGTAGLAGMSAGTAAAVGAGTTAAATGAKFIPKAIQGVKKAKQVVDTVDQVVDTGKQVAQMFQQPADYKTGNNYGSYSLNNRIMMNSQMQQMGLPQYDDLGNQNFFREGGQYKIGSPATPAGFSPEVYQQYGMNLGFDPKSAPAVTPSGPAYLSSIYNPVGNI